MNARLGIGIAAVDADNFLGDPSEAAAYLKLLPYCGDRAPEHYGDGKGASHTARTYASDLSGTKTYQFNACGFRGEDLDPKAAARIFVCGASYAFGTGLEWEETWGYHLKVGVARHLELDASRVNLLNFSQSLASADYITRTLLAQCAVVRPDLVVAHYSVMSRAEYFLRGAAVGVMPTYFPWYRRWWALRPGWKRRLFRLLPGPGDRAAASARLQTWDHYARLYSAEKAFVSTLTNILLLQSYCRAHGINCLISWVEHDRLREKRFSENLAISPLIDLLDGECFCPFSLVDADICMDVAADGIHPGVRSNQVFAERLLRLYTLMRVCTRGS